MKLLIIDDNLEVLEVTMTLLEHLGHTVVTALGGKSGIEKFESEDFDIVITDIIMPDLDGERVAEYIRGSGKKSAVVGMSGTPWEVNRDQFDAFLSKPFSIMDVFNCIEDLWVRPNSTAWVGRSIRTDTV